MCVSVGGGRRRGGDGQILLCVGVGQSIQRARRQKNPKKRELIALFSMTSTTIALLQSTASLLIITTATTIMTTPSNGHNNGVPPPSAIDETVEAAIAAAESYHGCGTTYLHVENPMRTVSAAAAAEVSNNHDENPTGAVVPTISLATTFKQRTPGEPMAR